MLHRLAERGFSGHVVLEVNTRRQISRAEREEALDASLEAMRTHLGQSDAPGVASALTAAVAGYRGPMTSAPDAADGWAERPAAVRLLVIETLLVLGVSLGRSAWYSVLSIIDMLTRKAALSTQTSVLNVSVTPNRPWLDLTYQLSDIVFPLVPVALAVFLLATFHSPPGPASAQPWVSLPAAGASISGGVRRCSSASASPGWGSISGHGLSASTPTWQRPISPRTGGRSRYWCCPR